MHFNILGEAIAIGKHLYALRSENEFGFDTSRIIWLIGSLGLDLRTESARRNAQTGSQYSIARNRWKDVFEGGIFVEPHMPELAEFKEYFLNILKVTLIAFPRGMVLFTLLPNCKSFSPL